MQGFDPDWIVTLFYRLRTLVVENTLCGPNGPYERQYIEPTPQRNPSMPALQLPCPLTRLGSGVPRPPHMRIRPGSSFTGAGARLMESQAAVRLLPLENRHMPQQISCEICWSPQESDSGRRRQPGIWQIWITLGVGVETGTGPAHRRCSWARDI